MRLSFVPGDLHLGQLEDGSFQVLLAGEQIFQSRSSKLAVNKFNEIRAELERRFPARQLTQEEKLSVLREAIADTLVGHNSLGGRKKRTSASSTRTFGG